MPSVPYIRVLTGPEIFRAGEYTRQRYDKNVEYNENTLTGHKKICVHDKDYQSYYHKMWKSYYLNIIDKVRVNTKLNRDFMHDLNQTIKALKEEYDLEFFEEHYSIINQNISSGRAEKIETYESGKEAHKVMLSGKEVILLYNPKTKRVESALPQH